MLSFDRIDVFEGIYVNKTNASGECIVFHYKYFLKINFRFESKVHNECNDILMAAMNFNDVAILNICGVDYCYIINRISKSEAVVLLQNIDLSEKSEPL